MEVKILFMKYMAHLNQKVELFYWKHLNIYLGLHMPMKNNELIFLLYVKME